MGLHRGDRPYIFEDVVNRMEQRLTYFQEAGDSNTIPAKRPPGEGRRPEKIAQREGHENLQTITEAPQEEGALDADGKDASEEEGQKAGGKEDDEGGEQGKELAEELAEQDPERAAKERRERSKARLRSQHAPSKCYLDKSGIMISLGDPKKVPVCKFTLKFRLQQLRGLTQLFCGRPEIPRAPIMEIRQ